MEAPSFVLLYFGTKIFVRCSEVSVVQRRPLMEVPRNCIFLHRQSSYMRVAQYFIDK